jgi:co-chaperonin GroES (HSP10)
MMTRPLHDRILAQRLDESDGTSGGLFVLDNAKENSLEVGRIIASSKTA